MPDGKENRESDIKQVLNTRVTLEEKFEKWDKKVLAVSEKGNQGDIKKDLRRTEK